MQSRRLGVSGPTVSALALGSWYTYGRLSFEAGVALVRRAFELGINTFDISYYRDQPHTEVLFGRILDVVGQPRENYRLIEKLWFSDYPARSLARQLDESLVRLGRDRVEVILSEHPRPGMSVEKLTEEVADLVVSGRAGCWGAMNWSIDDIRRGYAHADKQGLPKPQVAELKYNIARSAIVDGERFRALSADLGVTLIASDVMEGGVLAGNLEPARRIGIDTGGIREDIKAMVPRLREIGERFTATPAQVAIAFCLANPIVSSVLFGVTRIAQLENNVAALDLAEKHGPELRRLVAPLASSGHIEEAPYTFDAALVPSFISDRDSKASTRIEKRPVAHRQGVVMRPMLVAGVLSAILAGLVIAPPLVAQGDAVIKTDPKLNAMLPAAARAKGVLTAATSASVPPLLYLDPATNQIVGAVADLTHAYAARLGIKIELVKTGGEAVIPGVLAKRYDIVAAMGDFISRRERLDFVDVVKGGNALITRKGNPTKVGGINDLCGRKLAVGKGSIQEQRAHTMSDACTKAGKAAIQVMGYSDGPTSMLALQSGRADVHWDDIAAALYKVKSSPNAFEIVGAPQDQDAPYAIGFPKEQPQLRDAVHAALVSLYKDGTYARILDKWGATPIALPAIVINGSKH